MNVWHKPYPYALTDDVIFKRHECEWVLSVAVAMHIKYNPRQLPVVIGSPTNEAYYLYLSLRRIRDGYRVISDIRQGETTCSEPSSEPSSSDY